MRRSEDHGNPGPEIVPTLSECPYALSEAEIKLGLTDIDQGKVLRERLTDGRARRIEEHLVLFVLSRQGFRNIMAMILDSRIYMAHHLLTGRGLGCAGRPVPSRHDLEQITRDTVTDGLIAFPRILQSWEPSKGATLQTFFVNHCVMAFAKHYHAWVASQRTVPVPEPESELRSAFIPIASILEPENRILFWEKFHAWFATVTDLTSCLILRLKVLGYSHQDIAERIGNGFTVRMVEGRLYRLRQSWIRYEGRHGHEA